MDVDRVVATGELVEGNCHRDDSGRERNLLAKEPIGVAGAVPAFGVVSDSRG